MTEPITIPCAHCDRRIEANLYAVHLKNCYAHPTETDEERIAKDAAAIAEDLERERRDLTPYERRIIRENARRFGAGGSNTKKGA